MTTGRTIAWTRWTFVGKVISLLFIILSRVVITFLFKEQAYFNFMPAVTFHSDFGEPKKIKSVTVSIVSSSNFYE